MCVAQLCAGRCGSRLSVRRSPRAHICAQPAKRLSATDPAQSGSRTDIARDRRRASRRELPRYRSAAAHTRLHRWELHGPCGSYPGGRSESRAPCPRLPTEDARLFAPNRARIQHLQNLSIPVAARRPQVGLREDARYLGFVEDRPGSRVNPRRPATDASRNYAAYLVGEIADTV